MDRFAVEDMDQSSPLETGIKAFLPPGFNTMEDYLGSLQSFLATCEPITNLMIVDYFTTNSWETRMPQEWRDAFESEEGRLSSQDLMELVSLGKLRDFKQPSTTSTEATTVDESRSSDPQDWPESLKEFVEMVKRLSINRTLDPNFTKFKDTLDIHLTPGMSPKKLHEVEILSGLIAAYAKDHAISSVIDLGAGQGYLSRVLAFQHQLCVLGVDSNTIQTCGAQTTQKRTEKLFVNKTRLRRTGAGAVGKKDKDRTKDKTPTSNSKYQASRPSTHTPSTSTSTATPTPTTVTAATTESECPFLERTSSRSSTTPSLTPTTATATPMDDPSLSKPTPSSPSIPGVALMENPISKSCKKLKTGSQSRSSSPAECLTRENSASGSSCKRNSRSRRSRGKREEIQSIPSSSSETPACPADVNDTSSVSTSTLSVDTSKADIEHQLHLQQDNAIFNSATDPKLATTPGSNFQLQHITHRITAATLPTLLKEHFPKKSNSANSWCESSMSNGERQDPDYADVEDAEARWTLCGLHACGDLTSNMIKLYLESSATCLFSVGCCYHWITERFDKDGNIVISDGSHGFPLSAAFNRHRAHLGEHAKMIACQSPERWLKYQKETEDAIHGHYFRALLHKLMVEKGLYPGPPTVAPVLGRMGKHRLKGFPHYLATAINRLRLPVDVIRSEEAQAAYEEFLEKDLYRIGILWALRTMLGPLFEGMILLDRATYLYESIIGDNTSVLNGKSVHLVAGFDVVESPRNMILIALKDRA
ncbi:hypothetical protein EDD11_009117 [Mortierella claussenii]|nr:hypothetical protein EDD11_009117 [Mortierella claussenii]